MSLDTLVRPSKNVQRGIIRLSTFDQVSPRIFSERILCYRLQDGRNPIQIFMDLQTALSHILDKMPFFAGRVIYDDPIRERLAILQDPCGLNYGVPFYYRNYLDPLLAKIWTMGSFDSMESKNFPISHFPQHLLWPQVNILPTTAGAGGPCFALQANFIPGGVLLARAAHHSVSDYSASLHVIGELARHYKALTDGPPIPHELFPHEMNNRERLSNGEKGALPDEFPDWTLDAKGEAIKSGLLRQIQESATSRVVSTLWYIAPNNLRRLKADATTASAGGSASGATGHVSLNDAVCALLWSSVSSARQLDKAGVSMSKFAVACDIRGRIDPPLHSKFIGNAAIVVMGSKPAKELCAPVTPHSLSNLAMFMRRTVLEYDFASLSRHIGLLETADVFSNCAPRKHEYFGPDILISNQGVFNHFQADFGSDMGHAVAVRYHPEGKEGVCIIAERLPSGGLEVLTNLAPDTTERLKRLDGFSRYAEYRCSSDDPIESTP